MKKERILLILIGVILCIMIILTFLSVFKKDKEEEVSEITPFEEITEEEERQTMITLYYVNTETNTLMPEARVIDAKDLLENPYKTLVQELLAIPRNEKLKSALPEGVKVNDAVLEGNVATIDLSKEFIENQQNDNSKITLSVYAIVNTLTELNEVKFVKILVDNEEKQFFDENGNILDSLLTRFS